MKNLRLSEDTAGLYVRKYDYFPTTPKNTYVEIYAECYPASEEVKKTTGHELKLDIYFSIDQYSYRELLIGVTLCATRTKKDLMDKEIDGWVRQFVTDRRLRPLIKRYLKFMELWENLEAPKMLEIEEQG